MILTICFQGFFGGEKHESVIGFTPFVEVAHQLRAPPEVKSIFCSMIKEEPARLDVAMRFQIYDVIVNTVVKIRKVSIAEDVKQHLLVLPDSRAGDCAAAIDSALRDPSVKWKR